MAQIPDKVLNIINQFLQTLKNNGIDIRQAVLFGGYAAGKSHEWSDIDLAIVSDIFEGNRFLDKNKIRRYKIATSSDLDVLPYHPNDFTEDDPFVKEILETGIRII